MFSPSTTLDIDWELNTMSLNRSFWWLHYAHATRLWCASTYSSSSSLATLSFVFKMCGRSGLKTSAMVGYFDVAVTTVDAPGPQKSLHRRFVAVLANLAHKLHQSVRYQAVYIRVVAQTNVVWLPNVTERTVAMSWIILFHNPVTEICVDLAPRWRNAFCTCRRSRTFLLRWGKWVQTVHSRAQDSSVSKT